MSTTSSKPITLSASAVKQFMDCSWLFYQTRFLKVPDHTHPKTLVGSLTHAILEAFCRPKHSKHYEATLKHGSVYGSPVLTRLVKLFRERHPDVTDEIIGELDKLVFVAINHDFACKGAAKVLPPEHPFDMDFGSFKARGFMDRVVLYDDHAVCRDYKTQSKRFTGEDLDWSLQAFFYQMAIWEEFKLPASVEFLLLRFPANKRDAERYIQTVEPLTDAQLEGFKHHLGDVSAAINSLTLEGSKQNLKCHKDEGFCRFVCSLRDPFDYWVLLGDGPRPLTSVRVPKIGIGERDPDQWAAERLKPKEGQRVERRRYQGCVGFYTETGRPRNFQ